MNINEIIPEHFKKSNFNVTAYKGLEAYGISHFAYKNAEKIAIVICKEINKNLLFQLSGVKIYFDCTQVMIFSEKHPTQKEMEIGEKIGIEIYNYDSVENSIKVINNRSMIKINQIDKYLPISKNQFDNAIYRHMALYNIRLNRVLNIEDSTFGENRYGKRYAHILNDRVARDGGNFFFNKDMLEFVINIFRQRLGNRRVERKVGDEEELTETVGTKDINYKEKANNQNKSEQPTIRPLMSLSNELELFDQIDAINNLCSSNACYLNLFFYLKNNIGLANKLFSELLGKEIIIVNDFLFEHKLLEDLAEKYTRHTFSMDKLVQDVAFSYIYKKDKNNYGKGIVAIEFKYLEKNLKSESETLKTEWQIICRSYKDLFRIKKFEEVKFLLEESGQLWKYLLILHLYSRAKEVDEYKLAIIAPSGNRQIFRQTYDQYTSRYNFSEYLPGTNLLQYILKPNYLNRIYGWTLESIIDILKNFEETDLDFIHKFEEKYLPNLLHINDSIELKFNLNN